MRISIMNIIGSLFFTFCLILFFPANAEIGKYPIKNFTPEEYSAGIQNIDFAQNRDMNLFVANNLGVLSFNGNQWETHAYNTGKKQRSLAFDEKTNRLYVGSQSDFGYFDHNWNYISLLDKIPEEERGFDDVWDVFIDGLKVYFCTFQAIFVFDGQSVSFIKKNSGFNRSFFSGNRLFTQSPLGELYEVEGLQISTTLQQGQKKKIVTGVIQHESGHLIFYNSGNIEFSTRYNVKDIFPELANVLKGNYVNHVLQLSDSRLVIATQQAGLFLYDLQSNLIENMTAEEGLQTNACLRTFQDNTGNLWVGMQNGIALVDINSPLKLINQDIELQGSGYEAFDTDHGTYYTTSNGIFYQAKASTKSRFIKGTQGPAYGIQMIDNKIYAGHHTGLFSLENGLARRIAATDGLWVVKQYRAKPEYAIGGTYSGFHLFRINEKGELDEVQKIDGFSETSRFFEEDRKGRLWVGQYYKGLYQLTLNETLSEIVVSRTPDSFDLNIGKNVILSRIDDELYLGTNEGLYKIDQSLDKIIAADHFADVVGNSWVYLIAQDKQKNVHLFSEDLVGFFKQVSTNNYAYIPSSLYQLRQSFNNDLLTVSTNTHGGVFYNANEGFIHYNPNLEQLLTIEKQPVVNKVYSLVEDSLLYSRTPFQSRTDSIVSIKIIQGTKALKFFVESFKYKDVNNRQFRYYLKGFDNAYGEWSSSPFKEYTNLTEGRYEFFVQINNHLGEIVTSIPFVIEVKPPFYKSTIAKTLYALLFLSILGITYRLQRRYYKGKQLRIEKVKKEELAEKQQELKKLREEKIEDELRHLNNLLAASTMNLVVKNEFMENIKEEIKQVNLIEHVLDRKKALKRIIREIDTTLKVQEDWKQFEYHFDKVHGDFLTRLREDFHDLTPSEQKLSAFLRLNMNTKEIANLMGISLRGVEIARYRLRKKLGLTKSQNLSMFILEY